MFRAPRVSSRCLGQLLRTAAKSQSRLQTTGNAAPVTPDVNKLTLTWTAKPPEASISPALLTRARSVSAEHAKLSAQNAENYDVQVAKKIGELGSITTALKNWQDAQHVRIPISPTNEPLNTVHN